VLEKTTQVARCTSQARGKLNWISLQIAACSLSFLLSGCILFSVNLAPSVAPLEEEQIAGSGKDKILLMDISGIISEEEKLSGLTKMPGLVAQVKEELEKAAEDDRVKAVVLRIDSPGGGVTASDIIYHEIRTFQKKTGKKIIANIMDLGTSGAYYIAASADRIVAQPTAVTGSIGVIMINFNLQGLLQKVGVQDIAIKSADKKDMGSPFRKMTPEEQKIFQGVIDQMYERFLQVVVTGRKKLNLDQVRKLADGRIYTAQQALEAGLIDQIGYLEDAIAIAKQETGLGEARVVAYHRPGSYKQNIYSQAGDGGRTINLINFDLRSLFQDGTPRFMYLWMP
jgi:protease IV